MFSNIIDFFIDYFTHLNIQKIVGGIIFLGGLFLLGRINTSSDANRALLYAISGIIVAGAGFIIISYDMAKDKTKSYNELETLANAHKQNQKNKDQTPPHQLP